MISKPEANTYGLKKYLAIGAIAGLLTGGAGAFGIFNYVIKEPLQRENAKLETDIARIGLDRRNHEQTVSEYVKDIERLRSELDALQADHATALQEAELELKKTRARLQDTEKNLKGERRRNQNPADGWSGKYN